MPILEVNRDAKASQPLRVAVLRCAKLPGFVTWDIADVDALFTDDQMLVAELAKLGAAAESVAWSDPSVDWSTFDVALLRSTWDYIDDRGMFLSVLADIEASSCILLNPLEMVRWNTDKSYLSDLRDWVIPIVPTLWPSGDYAATMEEVIDKGWGMVVIKPMVGAGGAGFRMVAAPDVGMTLESLTRGKPEARFLIQPLVESVRTDGELGFVFVDGSLTHVLHKMPASGEYRTHGIYGGSLTLIEPSDDDRREAEAIMEKLPFRPLYARLDLVRVDGRLAVMELELVEPMLYFDLAPHAAERLARAVMGSVHP